VERLTGELEDRALRVMADHTSARLELSSALLDVFDALVAANPRGGAIEPDAAVQAIRGLAGWVRGLGPRE